MSPWLLGLILAVLLVVLGVLAAVIWRQRQQAERRARNMRALFEVSRQATANLERQQVLEVVVQAVQDVMGYRLASILLLDEAQQVLISSAISSNLRDLIPLGDRVPLGRGLVGAAAMTGRTQLANDVTRDPHYVRAPGGWDPGSELSVPLRGSDGVIGVLDVEDERRGAFGDEDVQVLEALAEQLVVILGKARLLESERRRAERIATLNSVARLITATLSVEALVGNAVQAISRHLHHPDVAVLLIDPEQSDSLVLRAAGGAHRQVLRVGEYRQALDVGLIGRAAREGRPVLVNDTSAEPAYLPIPRDQGRRAELAVPIRLGERVLGVLNIEDDQPFSADDVYGFEIIADQLAIALDNARLFADTQANLAQLATLFELSQRLSLAHDPRAMLRIALEVLAAHSPYRVTVAVFDFDAAGRPTGFYAPFYYQPGEGIIEVEQRLPVSDDALNPLLDGGQTVAIADVSADPRVPDFLRDEQMAVGRPALALIPLIVGARRIGNLVLTHREPHAWSEVELRLFRAAANQVAAALENARRLEREKARTEHLALIARVGQRIAARLDPDELLATTVEALHSHLSYDHVAVFLLEVLPDGPWLTQRARASRWPRGESARYRQRTDHGLLGAAARERLPQLVNDVAADPRYVAVPNTEIRAELAVPILMGERLLGVLDVAGVLPFQEDDVSGLLIISDQLAVALENAALYERAQTVGVLEERQRLARDLHDSVTQLIFSLTLIAQSVGPAYRRDPAEGERRIGRMLELSTQSLAEMRALLAELRPAGPVPNGLLPALEKHIQRVAARERLEIALEAPDYQARHPDHEEALYRVVQESLNNIVKHARARQVHVRLSQAGGRLELAVSDDGQGYDAAQPPAGGLGLVGMRERVERFGGALTVESAPGSGTTVRVTLPD